MANGNTNASFTVETASESGDSPRYIGSDGEDFEPTVLEPYFRAPSVPSRRPTPPPPPAVVPDVPRATPAAQTSIFATSDPVKTAIDHQLGLVFDYFEHRRPGLLIEYPGLSIDEPMNPLIFGSTFAAAFSFLSGLTSTPNRAVEMEKSKTIFARVLPIFHALQDHSNGALFEGKIQTVGRNEDVDPNTDFVFMKKRHLDSLVADISFKANEIHIRPFEGYPVPQSIRREDIHFAETARRSLQFSIDGHTTISPPIPAHLVHNSIALRRYLEQCLPGTPFFENCPADVAAAREAFMACLLCGLFHVGTTLMCSNDKLAERAKIADNYELVQSYQSLYFVPAFLNGDMDRHHFHYRSVYPGSYFLFSRVPAAIAAARYNYKVCIECGLLHKTGFTANSYSCPYPLAALAESAVNEHAAREFQLASPPFHGSY
jgi:hypothetical protein